MKEKSKSMLLMDKLVELNDLEINKAKISAAIFTKTANEMINKKIQSLEISFEEQAEFYGQNLTDYEEIYHQIKQKYQKQLEQVIEKYNHFYINMLLELQEAECNQKIAITNLKKCFDIKQEILNKAKSEMIEQYNQKITACIQKKTNYDVIIEACENEIEQCKSQMQNKMNSLFSDKSGQISLKEENVLKKWIHKIKNKFTGAKKFNTYVVEPMSVELEMMENKLPDVVNHIKQDTIRFVAKMKQAKEENNKMFENTMNQ